MLIDSSTKTVHNGIEEISPKRDVVDIDGKPSQIPSVNESALFPQHIFKSVV